MSWVLLTPDRAYKLKKPVHFGFLDLREPAARQCACEEEVAGQPGARRPHRPRRARGRSVERRSRARRRGRPGCRRLGRRDDPVRRGADHGRRDRRDALSRSRTWWRRRAPSQRFHADAGRPTVRGWSRQVAEAWRRQHRRARRRRRRGADAGAHRRLAALRLGFLRRRARRTGRAGADRARRGRARRPARGARRARRRGRRGRRSPRVRRTLRCVDVADDLAFLVMDLRRLGAAGPPRTS